MSLVFKQAASQWNNLRADYENVKQSQYEQAEQATRGAMLNRRGQAKGIDSYSLFSGNAIRAYAYASEELIEWWQSHPRITFADYEEQMLSEY